MRLILWIAISVSTLAGASFAYYKFRQNLIIARPLYIDEFKAEAQTFAREARAAAQLPPEEADPECMHLRNIDWQNILDNHTVLQGLQKQDIDADSVWTLRLGILAFLGMEYQLFEIDQLQADSITYRLQDFSEEGQSSTLLETQAFEQFRIEVCGIHQIRPPLYASSELGQVALPMPKEFDERFMNQAEFRKTLGQRLNKQYRIDVNHQKWTIKELLTLSEQR